MVDMHNKKLISAHICERLSKKNNLSSNIYIKVFIILKGMHTSEHILILSLSFLCLTCILVTGLQGLGYGSFWV